MGFLKKLFGVPDIEAMRASYDTTALLTVIANPDWKLRQAAVEALGQLKCVQSVPFLLDMLANDEYLPIRATAAEALGRIGDLRAVRYLISSLTNKPLDGSSFIRLTTEDSTKEVRRQAAGALGVLGDKNAVDALINALLDDVDESVRQAAAAALATLRDIKAIGPIRLALLNELIPRKEADAALEAIAPNLGSGDHLESVLTLLNDPKYNIQSAAIRAFSRFNYKKALEPIAGMVSMMSENDPLLSAGAVFALARMGDARAIEPLVKFLTRTQKMAQSFGQGGSALGNAAIEGTRLLAFLDHGKSGTALENALIEGAKLLAELLVTRLVAIYSQNSKGFVKGQGGASEIELRNIGQSLYDLGGIELMRTIHASFVSQTNVPGAARNLEHMWDGIGSWQG